MITFQRNYPADPDQVEDIIRMIGDMGISVGEEAPDDDQLLLGENSNATDDSAAEEAAAALASVENDVGRTTDPVRMYMREMGTVELLTREGEIIIAKRIEEGIREVMQAMAYYPGIVESVLATYDRIQIEEGRMSDLLAGFLDPDPEEEITETIDSTEELNDKDFGDSNSEQDNDDSDDEEEGDTGPDPEEVKARFETIRVNLAKAEKVITKKGRESKEGKDALTAIGDVFSSLKLTPRLLMNSALSSALSSTLFEIKSAKSCDCVPNKGSLIEKFSSKNGMVTRLILSGFPGSPVKEILRN